MRGLRGRETEGEEQVSERKRQMDGGIGRKCMTSKNSLNVYQKYPKRALVGVLGVLIL